MVDIGGQQGQLPHDDACDDDGSCDGLDAVSDAFEEREERLKERFLELEGESVDADAWTGPVFSIEDDDERRERERREYWDRCELEDRQEEHRAIQEIYKRASTRAFRRLKNLPEPPPGCHYTGCGEDEGESDIDYHVPPHCYPGDDEDSADDGRHSPSRTVFPGGIVAPKVSQVPSHPAHPQHTGAIRYGRLRRRRHQKSPVDDTHSSQSSLSARVMAQSHDHSALSARDAAVHPHAPLSYANQD